MVGEASLLEKVDKSVEEYEDLVRSGVQLQREIEGFYIRQEAHIRKRVAVIDELQSCLTEERRCLELQHQECRAQISAARRNIAALKVEENALGHSIKSAEAVLLAEEASIDAKLEELSRCIAQEDEVLNQLFDKRDALEQEERAVQTKGRHQQQEEEDLTRALREIDTLTADVEQRKKSLLKKDETIAEWNRSLETRERELVRCRDQLRDDLRQLEHDESRHGVSQAANGTSSLVPVISQREVMDDHNMSIERESNREEIDLEDDGA